MHPLLAKTPSVLRRIPRESKPPSTRCENDCRIEPHNIELSSAADHDPQSRCLTGLNEQFQAASKATAPTICYLFRVLLFPTGQLCLQA